MNVQKIGRLLLLFSVATIYMQCFSYTAKLPTIVQPSDTIPIETKPKRLWNLKNVDILTFIRAVSEETGKNFAVDPAVTGKITLISSQPLTADELYQAFLSTLLVNGYLALPDGKTTKIVPNKSPGLSSPIYSSLNQKQSDGMAVSIIPIRNVPALDLANVMRQFVSPEGHVAAYEPSNDIIIADRVGNITNMRRLVSRIDQQKASRIKVIRLRYAIAKNLVDTLNTAYKVKGINTLVPIFSADERSNSILISGGFPEQRNQILSVVRSLDTPNVAVGNYTEVIYLKHLNAERAATIVNGLIQNYLDKTPPKQTSQSQVTTSQSTTSSPSSGDGSSSLFSATIGSSSNNQQQGPMYSTSSTLYTSNSPDNNISDIVQKIPKSGSVSPSVQWEASTNSLIVTAERRLLRRIRKVIRKLDLRRPQVLIEAVIAEVSSDLQRELGVEWNISGDVALQTRFLPILPLSFIGDNGRLATLAGGPNTVGEGLNLMQVGNQIRFLLRALEHDNYSNVLATPNLVTLDNEPAQIKVGSKVSFATAQIQNNPTGGNPFNFFNREDVGLILTVEPQITPNGSIKLLIQQELSRIIPGTQRAGGNPDTTERFIRTTVMVDDGRVLVLGGLLQNEWDDNLKQVPWIGNIPFFGFFFRDRAKTSVKTNLMIFLRPTILYDKEDDIRVSGGKYEFLRQSQLQSDSKNPFKNSIETPVLPPLGNEITLPPPFMF